MDENGIRRVAEAAKVQELDAHRQPWQEGAIAWRNANTDVPEVPIDKLVQAQRVNDELDRYAREHPKPEQEAESVESLKQRVAELEEDNVAFRARADKADTQYIDAAKRFVSDLIAAGCDLETLI